MKPFVAALAALIGLAITGSVLAQKDKPFDFTQAESPRKPAPEWFRTIDQGDKDARLKGYLTAEGIKVEIVAEQPVVINPVGMTFADDGGLYVLEWTPGDIKPVEETITYKDGSKRPITCWKKSTKDVVKRLRDTNGDGIYDEAQVVLEEEFPSSILIHDGWLYLSGRGSVRRYRQSQKDGPFDVKEVIAQGFSGLGHEQVSGLTLGHDGWLYITSGDGDNVAEGSDGSRAVVLRTGGVFRCRLDGSKLHAYAIGFRNPYRDVAFDIGYQMFLADNDSPDDGKFAGCRLIQVAEGGDYGWRRLPTGQADTQRAAVWGELPGKLTPMLKTGKGAPAGLLIYEEDRFPEHLRGLIFYPDVVRQSIRGYQLRSLGSTFEAAREFELMKSNDPLFRPCQMVAGPDGAIYVCDWRSDSDGTKPANGKTGRIYRLSWSGTPEQPALPLRKLDSWAKLSEKSLDSLAELMGSANQSDRLRAQREMARRGGDEIRKSLLKDLLDGDQNLLRRIAALGALNSMWNRDVKLACISMLEGGPPDLRRLAAEGLALNGNPGDIEVHAALLRALADQNLAARRAVALAMGKIGHPDAADSLISNFRSERDFDPYLNDGYFRAIERLGKPGIDKLIELSLSGDPKDFDRVVDAFLALRTREAADGIPELLKYPHLTVPQRTRLLETYRHFLTEPPVSLSVVAEFLTVRPNEPAVVKLAGLQSLALAGQLKGERIENLAINLLDDQDADTRRAIISIIEAGRVKRAAPKLAGLLAEPNQVDAVPILKALRVLEDKSVVPVVKEVALGKSPAALEGLRTLATLDAKAAQETVQMLGATPAAAKQVGEALLAKKLPAELSPQVIEALKRHADKDADIAKLLAEVMKLNPPK